MTSNRRDRPAPEMRDIPLQERRQARIWPLPHATSVGEGVTAQFAAAAAP
jgi:hypothetical protein